MAQIIALIAIAVVLLGLIAYAAATRHKSRPTQFSPTKAERYSLMKDLNNIEAMQRQQFQSARNPLGRPTSPSTFKQKNF